MHTNQTYNSLIIENPEYINLPDAVKEHSANVNWGEVVWNTFGLPAFHSNFSITGEQLYFDSGADGQPALKQSDFTGVVVSSSVITPNNCESVFVISVELEFCKGRLCGSSVVELAIKPRKEYDEGFKNFVQQQERMMKIVRSRWFRWFYVPYYNVIKWTTISIVFVIEFLMKCFVWCMEKITPIKI